MNSTERVGIFIDGSNFYHGLKANLDYSNIDFEKFCNQLLAGRRLTGDWSLETTFPSKKASMSSSPKFARNNAYDTAILVSGDGDFAPALEFLKEYGKHIENAYFSKGRSFHLSNHSDRFLNLDQFPWEELKL